MSISIHKANSNLPRLLVHCHNYSTSRVASSTLISVMMSGHECEKKWAYSYQQYGSIWRPSSGGWLVHRRY
eukprot:scaffold191575_cov53-Prasinocladus_malaysianus.AAC.1